MWGLYRTGCAQKELLTLNNISSDYYKQTRTISFLGLLRYHDHSHASPFALDFLNHCKRGGYNSYTGEMFTARICTDLCPNLEKDQTFININCAFLHSFGSLCDRHHSWSYLLGNLHDSRLLRQHQLLYQNPSCNGLRKHTCSQRDRGLGRGLKI